MKHPFTKMNHCLLTLKNFYFNVRNNSRTLRYNTIITDNGLTKVKTINENRDYKWVKIANRNNLDKLK